MATHLLLFPAQLLQAVQQLHLVLTQLSQQLRAHQLFRVLEHGLAKMAAPMVVAAILIGWQRGELARNHHVVFFNVA